MRSFLVYWAFMTAYLDAGTGSMLVQGVVAALVTVPFMLRAQIRRALSRVRGERGPRR